VRRVNAGGETLNFLGYCFRWEDRHRGSGRYYLSITPTIRSEQRPLRPAKDMTWYLFIRIHPYSSVFVKDRLRVHQFGPRVIHTATAAR